jgi:hypothetical protein
MSTLTMTPTPGATACKGPLLTGLELFMMALTPSAPSPQ